MQSKTNENKQYTVRYEPDERPALPLCLGLGLQNSLICVAGIVITPAIVIQAAGIGDPYMSWAVCMALVISGLTTILQAIRCGRIGSGYILTMGTSATFIAASIFALKQGGPSMLASLVLVSSLFQFIISTKLSIFRRIITPTVTGTVIMLIAVSVMPVVFDLLNKVPQGTSPMAAPISAAATLLCVTLIILRTSAGIWRLWAVVIGVIVGCVVSSFFGLYDTDQVAQAAWIGLSLEGWPGFNLNFSSTFWALLPSFVLVTLVGAIETVGDAAAIQGVSWRKPRAVDFRAIQGAVAADGVGNLLSGLVGTVPNTTYSSSISVTEITRVAASRVGVWTGFIFVIMAFLPKVVACLLAIPGPVAGAYLFILVAILFVVGTKMVVQDGLDSQKSAIVGISFWIGVGFQNKLIFFEHLSPSLASFLDNGMTAGGLTAILLTMLMEFPSRCRRRIKTELDVDALPKIKTFLQDLTARLKWSNESINRLYSAVEETLFTLVQGERENGKSRHLLLTTKGDRRSIELELITTVGEDNLEDQMVLLSKPPNVPEEREISLRLLRHVASSVRHQQYHDTDIITIKIDALPR